MGAALKLCENLEAQEPRQAPPQLRLLANNDNSFPGSERPAKTASRANLHLVEDLASSETETRFKVTSSSEFTGKEEDVEVGLQYFGKRYLNPLLGRWVSADPLELHAVGQSGELNVYSYISGHVLKNTDPLGLCGADEPCSSETGGESVEENQSIDTSVSTDANETSYLQPEAEAAEADSAIVVAGRTDALQVTSYPDEARDEAAKAWASCSGANSGGGACYFGAAVTGTMLNAYAFGGDLLNTGNSMLRSVEAASEGEVAESGAYALQAVGNITYALQALRMLRSPMSVSSGSSPSTTAVNSASAADEATTWQAGSSRYPGVDDWGNTTLKQGTVVYSGAQAEGAPRFFTTGEAVVSSGMSREVLFKGLQVLPHAEKGYRQGVTAWVVTQDTRAAASLATANAEAGGMPQFFVPDTSTMRPVFSIPLGQ